MYRKSLLLLIYSFITLGSALNNRYIRQDSDYVDCSSNLDKNFAAAYPQCANNPGLTNIATSSFETFLQDLICDAKCGMQYLSLFVAQCPFEWYPETAEYYRLQCKVNTNGRPCYSFYKNSMLDTSVVDTDVALELCRSSIKYNICSDECNAQLRAISTYYGSCVYSIFNSSLARSSGDELASLFSYQLWTSCGVSVPTAARRWRAKVYV